MKNLHSSRVTTLLLACAMSTALASCDKNKKNDSEENGSNTPQILVPSAANPNTDIADPDASDELLATSPPTQPQTEAGTPPSEQAPQIKTGYLRSQNATQGVTYKTDSQEGMTGPSGQFKYLDGEDISFSIGEVEFPTIKATQRITPMDLAEGNNTAANNITRLLLSLDADANEDNGIQVPQTAAQSAEPIDFSVGSEVFSEDPGVINLVANSGAHSTELASVEKASNNLNNQFTVNLTIPVRADQLNDGSLQGRTLRGLLPAWSIATPGVRQDENTLGRLENNRATDGDVSRWFCFVNDQLSLSFALQGNNVFLTEHTDNVYYTGTMNTLGSDGVAVFARSRKQPVPEAENWRSVRFILPGQVWMASQSGGAVNANALSVNSRITYQQSPARFRAFSEQRGELTCELYCFICIS